MGMVFHFANWSTTVSLQNLSWAKSLVIDKSIQTAYIQAIRSAQHFIYIENQYFLGSSYAWPAYKEAGFGITYIFVDLMFLYISFSLHELQLLSCKP